MRQCQRRHVCAFTRAHTRAWMCTCVACWQKQAEADWRTAYNTPMIPRCAHGNERMQMWLDDWLEAPTNFSASTAEINISWRQRWGKFLQLLFDGTIFVLGFLSLTETLMFMSWICRLSVYVWETVCVFSVVYKMESLIFCPFWVIMLSWVCVCVPRIFTSSWPPRLSQEWGALGMYSSGNPCSIKSSISGNMCRVRTRQIGGFQSQTKGRKLLDCKNFSRQSFSLEGNFCLDNIYSNSKKQNNPDCQSALFQAK